MVIASRTRPEHQAEWLLSRIAEAQAHLKKLPRLRLLVDDFRTFQPTDKIKNIFVNFCIDERAELTEFEEFLSWFGVLSWPRNNLNRFRSRVLANSWEESMSALVEGVIARYYSKKLGVANVEPSPSVEKGKFSDIRLMLGDRRIYLEMTSVSTSLFEQKLEDAFDRTCKMLIPEIEGNRFVDIIVDTTKLPLNAHGHLDVAGTVSMLNRYVTQLGLMTLFNGSVSPLTININKIAQLPETTIFELAASAILPNSDFKCLQFLYPDLERLLSDEVIAKWARTIRPSLAKGCPIAYFGASNGELAAVQIQSQKFHPSLSSELEIKSFLVHIGRVLEEKIAEGQFQPGCPNIIVIRAHNWLSHGYEEARDLIALDFNAIESAVVKILDKMRNPHVACVKVYESDYGKARIITNKHVSATSHLSEEEIGQLR